MAGERVPTSVNDCYEKPKFWDNDERMNSWFAPFRNRDLNPLNYDNKMNYWKDNINFYCDNTRRCVLSMQDVKNFFIRNGKAPACLSTVFERILRDGAILEQSDFGEYLANNSWSGWAMNRLYNSPMKWLSKKVVTSVSASDSEIDENVKFIHLESLKKQADDLHRYVTKEFKNGLVTYEIVRNIYSEKLKVPVDMNLIKLLVQWLVHQKKTDVIFESKHLNVHLLKFSVNSQPVEQINDSEIAVYCLQAQEKSLSAQLEKYEQEVKDLVTQIKDRLKQGQKNMARTLLRKKKDEEKKIDKVLKAMDNIQTLLYTVEETETDKKIIRSYQAGAQTLKSKFKVGDLNLNQVDMTMSEVDEVLNMHADIQTTLGQPLLVESNDGDLEDELSELLLNDMFPPPPGSVSPLAGDKSSTSIYDLPSPSKELPELAVRNLVTEYK